MAIFPLRGCKAQDFFVIVSLNDFVQALLLFICCDYNT